MIFSVAGDIGQRRYKIVSGRQDWRAAIGIEQRPVLQVHVGVANHNRQDEAADELISGQPRQYQLPENGSDREHQYHGRPEPDHSSL